MTHARAAIESAVLASVAEASAYQGEPDHERRAEDRDARIDRRSGRHKRTGHEKAKPMPPPSARPTITAGVGMIPSRRVSTTSRVSCANLASSSRQRGRSPCHIGTLHGSTPQDRKQIPGGRTLLGERAFDALRACTCRAVARSAVSAGCGGQPGPHRDDRQVNVAEALVRRQDQQGSPQRTGLPPTLWAHLMFITGAVQVGFYSLITFLIAVPTGGRQPGIRLPRGPSPPYRSGRVTVDLCVLGAWRGRRAGMPIQREVSGAQVVFRPVASPLPLGLLALAVATFSMAGLQLSWLAPGLAPEVGLLVLVFAVPLQALSSVFGFLARDPAASTGMALQAAGWLAIGLGTYSGRPGQPSPALGLVLVGAASVLLVPVITAARGKVLASGVMALTSVRFYLTAAAEFTASPAWRAAAGVAGLVLAVTALYAGLAFELEDSAHVTVLPTFRRRQAQVALTGDPSAEVRGVEHEAGVRRTL